jgi:MFS family permease
MYIRAFERRGARRAWPVYLSNLFFSLSYAVIIYINSSYLLESFGQQDVVLLFVLAAFGNIFFFFITPALVRYVGNKRVFVLFLLLQLAGISGLIIATSPLFLATAFFLYGSTSMMVYYSLDLFIEAISNNADTGEIRGITLTLDNISIAAAPLVFALLTLSGQFKPVYVASSLLILPVIFIALFFLKDLPTSVRVHPVRLPFRAWWKKYEARRSSIARFVLEVFYSVMVIYMPIYLSRVIGFSWHAIGIVFAIMLLPFVLFELPIGELADHWCGEREIMTIGFLIMGMALLCMPFLGTNMYVWAAVLFLSRIGAAFVEITSEVHFFRSVNKEDTGLISIFRLTRPVAIALGALFGAAILYLYSFYALFFFLALAMLMGMRESARLKDDR